MSTTSSSAIQDSLDNIESEIARLEKARDALLELVGAQDEEAEVEEAPRRSRRRRAKAEEENGADEEKVTRRSTRGRGTTDRRPEERASKSKSTKGKSSNEDKPARGSRKEQIIGLLEDGMTPREVADELGIATNYVYNVKREM